MTLEEYLSITSIPNDEFAIAIGTSVEAVRLYRKHKRVPHRDIMARITEATGQTVMPNDFYGVARAQYEAVRSHNSDSAAVSNSAEVAE